ncbi:hypothetical protein Cgig2_022556 [Carnegiea gigantea]|uniref:AB hydrolase-1 domain-containing protein n=1 Tax=Carnegiea gigantea TaxID=171969 RepID=A0A9Q1QKL4_9CARY|nr:hypothetical protein Cgig2_022556 [Carnegiea gigantea]
MLKNVGLIFLIAMVAWAYHSISPPPPTPCGAPGGPPVTALRIKLRDGRYLAYKESGVPKENAKFKIVFAHGFSSCRHDVVIATQLSQEVIEELGVHIVSFDRPGYGESDPHPKRTMKSMALDVEELADQLGLGHSFYLVGFSMGGHTVWSCLKYIPHRMPDKLSLQDLQLISKVIPLKANHQDQVKQQGEYESIHRDMMIGFGGWEFSPMDLANPFPNGNGSVHLWQGDEDGLVPVTLQRYIAKRLPWIKYHEIAGAGHLFPFVQGMVETIVRELLGEK